MDGALNFAFFFLGHVLLCDTHSQLRHLARLASEMISYKMNIEAVSCCTYCEWHGYSGCDKSEKLIGESQSVDDIY